jgi:F-type H+-transporting ATPase subunit gamma
MATLKEIKARIGSVQRTLKITSVMKMVASAKFHRTQSAAKSHSLYHQQLDSLLQAVCGSPKTNHSVPLTAIHGARHRALVVAFASNSSLCGRFNANAIKAMETTVEELRNKGYESVAVVPVGEKMRQAVAKGAYATDSRLQTVVGKEALESLPALAGLLAGQYASGEVDLVTVVYNHFRSMGHQEPLSEQILPMTLPLCSEDTMQPDYIFEPEPSVLLARLLPPVLTARLRAIGLDAAMAEHAARTVAMQTATDNAQDLLDELSLSYNKQRQQAITNELADITQATVHG